MAHRSVEDLIVCPCFWFGAWPARLTGGRSAPQTPLILQGGYRPPINPPLQSVLLHLRAFLAPLEPPYGEAKRTALKTLIRTSLKTHLYDAWETTFQP